MINNLAEPKVLLNKRTDLILKRHHFEQCQIKITLTEMVIINGIRLTS